MIERKIVMKKRVLSLLLSTLLIMTSLAVTCSAEGAPQYNIQYGSATAGETFDLEVMIENNPGIISLRFSVEYDPEKLQLVDISDSKILNGYTAPSPEVASPYTLRWADSLSATNNSANGKVVTLKFKALAEGTSTVSVIHEEARNSTGQKIVFSNASVDVEIEGGFIPGDVNGDGDVTTSDVLLLRKSLVGLVELTEEETLRGDLTGDGDITTSDVLRIRRIIVGLD